MEEITLAQIMGKLKELQSDITSIKTILSTGNHEIPKSQSPPEIVRPESFMEFYNKFNPQNDVDRTIVIMRFQELHRGKHNITTKDIAEGFREVRERTPKNVADKIQWLHKKGKVMPGEIVDNLKGWVITRSGLDYLEELKNGKNKKE